MVIVAAVMAGAAAADQARVDRALGGVGLGEGMFTDDKMKSVVVPYRANPPEQNLKPEQFDESIRDIRQSDTKTGRMLRATEDSAEVRPKVDIDGQGPLFDDANYAHENAGKIFGDIFTSEDPTCEPSALPSSRIIDQFCESFPKRRTRRCRIERKIWVDRTDTYRCDKRARKYVKVCEKETSYSCEKPKKLENCLARHITVAGASHHWREDRLVIEWEGLPPSPAGSVGHLRKVNFELKVSDHVRLSEAVLRRIEANGVLQVIGNGEILGTFGGVGYPSFARPGAHCPADNTSAKLVAATLRWNCSWPSPATATPVAVLTNGPLTAESNYSQASGSFPDWDMPGGPSPYDMEINYGRWEDGGGEEASEQVYRCYQRYPNPAESCHLYATLNDLGYQGWNVLRFMNVNERDSLNPETDSKWASTAFQARIAYDGASSGAAGRLELSFKGACCDAFKRNDDELCE